LQWNDGEDLGADGVVVAGEVCTAAADEWAPPVNSSGAHLEVAADEVLAGGGAIEPMRGGTRLVLDKRILRVIWPAHRSSLEASRKQAYRLRAASGSPGQPIHSSQVLG